MREFFQKHLQGKKVLVWFLFSSAVYGAMAIFTLPRLQKLSNGLQLFDVKMDGYTPEYALRLLLALGQEGRHIYLTQQMPLDMLYPFTFAVSNSLIIAWLLHKLNWFESPAFYLVLLPIVGGLLDYFENFTVITMLLQFHAQTSCGLPGRNLKCSRTGLVPTRLVLLQAPSWMYNQEDFIQLRFATAMILSTTAWVNIKKYMSLLR